MVDAAVAEHLEVLRPVSVGLGGAVERIRHAHALDRSLLDPVDDRRVWQTRGLEHRGRDVDHVVELGPHLAARVEPVRPVHDRAVARPPQWEATCFVHWYGVSIAWAHPTA